VIGGKPKVCPLDLYIRCQWSKANALQNAYMVVLFVSISLRVCLVDEILSTIFMKTQTLINWTILFFSQTYTNSTIYIFEWTSTLSS
jgi:hypothetical protein